MPVYHKEPENDSAPSVSRRPYQSFALGLLHFGPIALYRDRALLSDAIAQLESESFVTIRFRCDRWQTRSFVWEDLAHRLKLPAYFGQNLDALSECMQDLEIDDRGGMTVVLDEFTTIAAREGAFARALLDVFAHGSRLQQLFGKTLIVLVQSDDPDASFDGLGSVSAWWNSKEFVRSARG